jgi:hypothetical protein
MADGLFGPEPDEDGGEGVPHGDLGNGHRIELSAAEWSALLHHPVVVEAITQRAADIADAANGQVVLDPRAVARIVADDGGNDVAYTVTVQNRSGTTRARARARTAGLLGMINEKHHAALNAAMLTYPSDPIPTGAPMGEEVELAPEVPEGGNDEAAVAAAETFAAEAVEE